MKKSFFIVVILATAISVFVFLNTKKKVALENDNKNEGEYALTIQEGLALLTPKNLQDVRVDEYFLLKKIQEKKKLQGVDLIFIKNKLADDPFKRLADKKDFSADIEIKKRDVLSAIGKDFDGNFYAIKSAGGTFGAWNDILVKALYCDKTGFDDQDFFILKLLRKQDGGYFDTHFLLALLLLKENGCYRQDAIAEQTALVSADILKAAENDKEVGDLYVERIVFLYWAGYGDSIKKEWIELVRNNFIKDLGWLDKKKQEFNVHVTGLALLSLMYYAEGENEQSLY
jgi:hypothetical protein